MKAEFEQQDIEAIAHKVAEILTHILIRNDKHEIDTILDVQGLAEYLRVSPKWIYEQTSFKSIPHYKLSNKQLRFRKTDIDDWLNKLKRPAMTEPTGKLRLISNR
jgi:excisionase family DNA binding protein